MQSTERREETPHPISKKAPKGSKGLQMRYLGLQNVPGGKGCEIVLDTPFLYALARENGDGASCPILDAKDAKGGGLSDSRDDGNVLPILSRTAVEDLVCLYDPLGDRKIQMQTQITVAKGDHSFQNFSASYGAFQGGKRGKDLAILLRSDQTSLG